MPPGCYRQPRTQRGRAQRKSGLLRVDLIEFDEPLGFLGDIAEKLILARYMEQLIVQRNAWLKNELESVAS